MSQTQTRRSSQVDLLHGPILKSLLLFALPIMASRVFQQIYNTMDTLIVGYTLGDSSIAAMGACSSIYEMMTGFTFGVGNGLAIVTARCFGRQETDRMKNRLHPVSSSALPLRWLSRFWQRSSCIRCCAC